MDLSDVRQHAQRLGSTTYFATVAESGYPAVTPVAVAWGEDGRLYAATSASSYKVRHLRARPEVTVHYPVGEATGFDQLSVRGTAEILDDAATRARLWQGVFDYDLAMFFGSQDNPELCFVAITPERATLLKAMGQGGREEYRPG